MSNVISFKPDQRGRAAVDQGADMGRILLFTGVRYFRDDVETRSEPEAETVLHEADPVDEGAATERLKA